MCIVALELSPGCSRSGGLCDASALACPSGRPVVSAGRSAPALNPRLSRHSPRSPHPTGPRPARVRTTSASRDELRPEPPPEQKTASRWRAPAGEPVREKTHSETLYWSVASNTIILSADSKNSASFAETRHTFS